MRHVIYLVLVANIVFFSWHILQLQKQEGIERALPGLPVTAKPLVTLQEMELRQQQQQAPASAPDPAAEPRPEPTLDKGLEEPQQQLAMVESLTELQPPGGGGAITCRTLGPIMAIAQLRLLSTKLDELGLEPRHRTYELQKETGYWVYLPAMQYSEAQAIKSKLDKHGDKEYYIGKDNFISLGTFRERTRAEVRREQISKLDLEAVIEPRYVIQTVHWLDIDRQTSNAVDLGAVLQDYPEIRLQEQACY